MIDSANPEWTAEAFAKAKSARDVLPGLFGKAQAKEMLQPKRGRPKATATKEHVNVRFDSEVLEQFRASGPGWQTRMNAVLSDWLKTHSLDELNI
ncbi:hypothetical protein D3C75_1208430 [compost metagenome]